MTTNVMPLLCWCGKRARYTRADGMPADNACTKAHMLAPEGHWYSPAGPAAQYGAQSENRKVAR